MAQDRLVQAQQFDIRLAEIPTSWTPLARIFDHEADYWTTIANVEQRQGWRFYYNRGLAPRLDPNHAGNFRGDVGSGDAIVRDIVSYYRTAGTAPVAYCDVLATPADMPSHLVAAGFRERPSMAGDLMIYVGPDHGWPSRLEVVQATSEAEQDAWAGLTDEDASPRTQQLLRSLYRMEIADRRVKAYLALIDGHGPDVRCYLPEKVWDGSRLFTRRRACAGVAWQALWYAAR